MNNVRVAVTAACALLVAASLLASGAAIAAEPPPPLVTPQLQPGGTESWEFEIRPEYRARIISINPLELSGVRAQNVWWAENRGRFDVMFARTGVGAIIMQADVLDGGLWGDNGTFGLEPEINSGLGIASKQPNLAGLDVVLRRPDGNEDVDPTVADNYVPGLVPIEPIQINYLYGEVLLPFGVLRVGRMPTSDGEGLAINDGRGGNLWGASYYHNASDRILFGTKISEAFLLLADKDRQVDRSTDDGVFLGLVYDILVSDEVYRTSDDLMQFAAQLDWKWKDFDFFGLGRGRLRLKATLSYRWNEEYNTDIFAVPMLFEFEVEDFFMEAQATIVRGSTQELSAGFAELTGGTQSDQTIAYELARLRVSGRLGHVTLMGEYAHASGDPDPRPETPMTIGSWARDTNLGLLLFERTLAFQSARSAAVGIENLKQLEAPSFPLTEIATEGRVTNTNAFFPQVFIEPFYHCGPDIDHNLRIKLGALFAWTDVPAVDPIMSILAQKGPNIENDLVNYHGGKPGTYWGTELDIGIEYTYKQLFELVLEAAMLFPGDALEDENGEAVRSWMVETRFRFML